MIVCKHSSTDSDWSNPRDGETVVHDRVLFSKNLDKVVEIPETEAE